MEDVVGPYAAYPIKHHPDLLSQGYRPKLVIDSVLRSKLAGHKIRPTVVATLPETETEVKIPGLLEKQKLHPDHTFAVVGYNKNRKTIQLRDATYPTTMTISFEDLRQDFYILVQATLKGFK
jgi:hypothetical protein